MPVKVIILVMVALSLASQSAGAQPDTCKPTPTVIHRTRSGPEFEAFLKWSKRHAHDEDLKREDADELSDPVAFHGVYIADINNDGKDEIIAMTKGGSGGYLSLFVFVRTDDGFKLLPHAPPKPVGGYDDWYSYGASDPLVLEHLDRIPLPEDYELIKIKHDQMLMRACGKTYMTFQGSGAPGAEGREGYIWINGANHRTCDRNWIAFNRGIFKKIYDRGYYARADLFLAPIADGCDSEIEPSERARVFNDLALTAMHTGRPALCAERVARARKAASEASVSPELSKAIAYNEQLCTRPQTSSVPDWQLLLSRDLGEGSGFLRQTEFLDLLFAIVPDKKSSSADTPSSDRLPLQVYDWLGDWSLPEPPQIRDSIVVISGSYTAARKTEDRAFLWMDTSPRTGAFAINSGDHCQFTIGSKTTPFKKLPAEFWSDFHSWEESLEVASNGERCANFISADGSSTRVSIPIDHNANQRSDRRD